MTAKRWVRWVSLLFILVLIVFFGWRRTPMAPSPVTTKGETNLEEPLISLVRSSRSFETGRRGRVWIEPASECGIAIRNEIVMSGSESAPRAMAADWVITKVRGDRSLSSSEHETLRRAGLEAGVMAGGSAGGLLEVRISDPSRPDAVDEALAHLRISIPDLAFAEPDYVIESAAFPEGSARMRSGGFWSLHNPAIGEVDVDAPEGWDRRREAAEVVVAVVDSGIDLDHPDLVANLWKNGAEIPANGIDDDENGFVDDVHGVNFVQTGGPPEDDSGHGTHCAGIIGADGYESAVETAGIAWRCQLMPIKVLDQRGVGTVSRAVAAIDYAIEHGASIANLSWNATASSVALEEALARAREAGMICVTAAGNEKNNIDHAPLYPASVLMNHVVTVSALARSGSLAEFSNFGRDAVTLSAPGQGILSTVSGGGTGIRSGTSMAAAHVTGTLALLQAQFPDEDYRQNIYRLLRGSLRSEGLRTVVQEGRRLNVRGSLATATIRPPFDNFSEAFDPGALLYFRMIFDPVHATRETGEGSHGEGAGGGTQWVKWSAPSEDFVELRTTSAGLAARVAVYRGDSLSGLTSVVSGSAATEPVTFQPVAGEIYRIAIDGGGSTSSGILTLFQRASNDLLGDALPLEGDSWELASHNRGASKEEGEAPHAGNGGGASLWWRWTAPRDGWYRISTAGSEIDTLLAVYRDLPEPVSAFAGPNQHVVFAIDISSSSRRKMEGSFVGDVNADGLVSSVLDAEIAAARLLLRLLEEQAPGATASLIVFDANAVAVDLDPAAPGEQHEVMVSTHFDAMDAALVNLRSPASGSNTEAALAAALTMLKASVAVPSQGEVILISDGIRTRGGAYEDEGAALLSAGYRLRAFGPGWTTDLAALRAATPEAVIFQTPEELLSLGWNSVASSDSSGSDVTSEVIFFAEAAQSYAIALDGYEGAQGRVQLSGAFGFSLEVISEAREVTVRRGERVILDAEVRSEFPVYYQWYFNGDPLLSETGKKRLVIDHAQLEDVGNYELVVTNGVQSVTSETMGVALETGPPEIVGAPTRLQTVTGETLILSLGIDDYEFPVDITWFFEGEEIEGEKGRRLQIAGADPSHAGTYHAVLTNAFGTTETEPIVVQIAEGPLQWEEIFLSAPLGDFSGGGLLNDTYLIGSYAGHIFLSDNGTSWRRAEVEVPPLRQDGFDQLLAISAFHEIGDQYVAFVWAPSFAPSEGKQGGWVSDDLEIWRWDPDLPFLKDVIPFDHGYLGLQPDQSYMALWHSEDGRQWNRVDLPEGMRTSATLPVLGNGKLLSVDQGTTYFSEDGVNWTADTSNLDALVERNAFIFEGGQFHAFELNDFNDARYSSIDGLEWEETGLFGDIARDYNATFLLRASSGYVMSARSGAYVSTDLSVWSEIPGVSFSYPLKGGVARGDEFLLYGYQGRLIFGRDLTLAHSLDLAETFISVREIAGKLIGRFLMSVKESIDGVTWNLTSHPAQYPLLAFGDGVYVRGRANPHVFDYSLDGLDWMPSFFSRFNHVEFKDMAFGDGVFVAVFEDGGIARSENGKDWTVVRELAADPASWDWRTVKYAGGAFFALSFDFNADPREVIVERSVDGLDWMRLEMPGNWEPYDIAFTNGRYVITGQGGQIRTSTDGINWDLAALPAQAEAATFAHVAAGRGYFVALSNHMVVMSRDGIEWYSQAFANLRDVAYYNGNFFLVGNQGLIYRSRLTQGLTPQLKIAAVNSSGEDFLFNQELRIQTELLNDAEVEQIDYYLNGELIATQTPPFLDLPWLPRSTGPHTFLAHASTSSGTSGTASTTIDVTFSDWQRMPSVAQPVAGMTSGFVVNGKYYGVGDDAVRISENGVHWNRYDMPEDLVDPNNPLGHDVPVHITHLAGNEEGVLVALIDNGKIGYSPNGIEWHESGKLPSAAADAPRFRMAGVAYGGGSFLLSAWDEDGPHESEIFTSPDGVTWSKRTTLPLFSRFTVYFNGGFILLGWDAEFNRVCYRSEDGEIWSEGDNLGRVGDATGRGLIEAFGMLIRQTVDQEVHTYISEDGLRWSAVEYAQGEEPGFILGHNGENFVAYEYNRSVYMVSDDLRTWVELPRDDGQEEPRPDLRSDLVRGPTGWLNRDGAFSTDLVTWVNDGPQPSQATAAIYAMAWSEDRLVAAGARGGVAVTIDGSSWVYRQLDSSEDIFSLAYGNGVFVAMTYNGRSYVSSDGMEWEEHENQPRALGNLTYANGLFILSMGGVATSTNGYEWESFGGLNLRSSLRLAYGEGVLAGVDNDETIVASDDNGATWRVVAEVAANITGTEHYMVYENSRFYAGSSSGCSESEDGLTWVAAHECLKHPTGITTGNGARWSLQREKFNSPKEPVYLSVDGDTWAPAFRETMHIAPFRGEIYAIDSFHEIHKFTLSDLRFESVEHETFLSEGDLFSVAFKVQNAGLADLKFTEPVTVEARLSTNREWGDEDDIVLGDTSVTLDVERNESAEAEGEWLIPHGLEPGTPFFLLLAVDSTGIVPEINESNNTVVSEQVVEMGARALAIAAFTNGRLLLTDSLENQQEFVSAPDEDLTIAQDAVVDLRAVAHAGYRLTGWIGGPFAERDPLTVTMDVDRRLASIFEPAPSLRFEDWRLRIFSEIQLGDPAISGPAADPDRDGLTNQVEFGLGTDALSPERAHPVAFHRSGSRLVVSYAKSLDAEATVRLQQSFDLQAWTDAQVVIRDARLMSEHVRYDVEFSREMTETGLFLRLSVDELVVEFP